ncbi:hypothetical protein D910_12404 [Dendroctonus ponderosae]
MDENSLLQNVPQLVEDVEEDCDNSSASDADEPDVSKPKKNTSKLSVHLRGLMGEANLRFARGEVELAKKMCFEVIRQSPEAFEPYLTLAQMYENQNIKKYRGFLMLAGHLQPSNADIWIRLADVEFQENKISAAVSCYNKAIRAEPRNIDLHMKRLTLVQEKVPTRSKSIPLLKLNMAKALPKSKHAQILQICTEVANDYFKVKNYPKAIEALQICTRRIPNNTTEDVLNMMLELLLLSERYSECLDIFNQFCGFQFDITLGEGTSITINSFVIPANLHLDIITKFIVCLIGLQSYHLAEGLLKEMLEKDDMEVNGMLYFDIAEALMSSMYYKEALTILIPLVKTKSFSLAAIWLKHAECLTHLNLFDQAIEAYSSVIKLAPNHVDVLYPLAMLLLKQDRKQEALEVLSQDLSSGKLHVAVLIEQMKLLKQIGDLENYWKCCELLLSRHCIVYKHYSELRIGLLSRASVLAKKQKIARMRMVQKDYDALELNLENIFEPSVEDEYKLYLNILQFAFENREYTQLQKFAFMGLASKRFQSYFHQIFLIACYACIFSKDFYHGYIIAKDLLVHNPNNNNAWNLYSIIVSKSDEETKMGRLFELVKANHCCAVAHYADCLNYFLKEYKNTQSSYSAFMIGLTMLQQYCQRKKNTIQKKSMVETVTYLFFNYANNRSKYAQQEVYYNLGRMYQQIRVFYLAEHFYKLVFQVQNEFVDAHPDYLDLKKEAAYNLHLIYKTSGNLAAARQVLWKYIVIE